MDFKILGPLEVADEGRVLEVGGSRQRQLLAILLLHRNDVVSSDRLIDHLWGAQPPPTAGKSLQVHVSRLRKALGARGRLVTPGSGYSLRADAEDIDAARFARQAEALAVYQEARRVLVEELGLEPGRTLHELEQAILRHEPALDPARKIPSHTPAAGVEPPPSAAFEHAPERKLATVLFVD